MPRGGGRESEFNKILLWPVVSLAKMPSLQISTKYLSDYNTGNEYTILKSGSLLSNYRFKASQYREVDGNGGLFMQSEHSLS